MPHCAASTGLSRCDQRVGDAAAATHERPGQGRRNPRPPPPDHRPATTAARRDGPVHASRMGVARRAVVPTPREMLRPFRLLVRPETVLRWHRDLIAARHARLSRPKRAGRPPTIRSVRVAVLRLARENSSWGYRCIHGELLVLGIKVAASTVWEILREAGIDPAPGRSSTTWATFLRSQAQAILAADFFETAPHPHRHTRVRPGHHRARHPPGPDPGRHRTPQRRVGSPSRPQPGHGHAGCRLPGTLPHPRPRRQIPGVVRRHRGISNARPLHPLPEPVLATTITDYSIHRRDRLGGIIHEYQRAA